MSRLQLRAFVRYDKKGIIAPGSLIIGNEMPRRGNWVEIDAYKSSFTNDLAVTKYMRAFVRYDRKGFIVPGSLILSREVPRMGRWSEVSMISAEKCCMPTTTSTTTSTTLLPTTTTTTTIP